eukprot:CAMPEP_0195126584 /NCGR_PEP_ID=MMETSP0448-20130528/135256_1 /TAXON_ID=66468 /ORGANISM="Heterocapsa triquestra, Strain CCMP 448" /LENGTH=55 /DNA_ID=CAMNT_0040164273 /DNA_START=40 /DNA_END=203 /DNA_ORIENTATION=-
MPRLPLLIRLQLLVPIHAFAHRARLSLEGLALVRAAEVLLAAARDPLKPLPPQGL